MSKSTQVLESESPKVANARPLHAQAVSVSLAAKTTHGKRLGAIAIVCLVLSSAANYALAKWLGISPGFPWKRVDAVYRRIGPASGPQIFCAGSSLLVWGLTWPVVSQSLGEGAENWTVAGSSPEVWEVFQKLEPNSNITIIGISAYDLNEMRLAPERARFVPFSVTLSDLSASDTSAELRDRILAQYALSYVRVVYPAAGDADKVLEGLRSKAAGMLGEKNELEQREGIVIEKSGVLATEGGTTSIADWPKPRILRRLDALRAENHGTHQFFNGPKGLALRRVLQYAAQRGRVIVVVLPVSQYYGDTFLDPVTRADFERAIQDNMAAVPDATLVRLDQIPGIADNQNFLDLVHMNLRGQHIATAEFLRVASTAASKADQQDETAPPAAPSNR